MIHEPALPAQQDVQPATSEARPRAEIRLPENRNKDTHNLGKTTLGRLLDCGLLAGRDAKFFLFKHLDRFKDFVFFLEIEVMDGSFVTVRRGVEEASKISFKKYTVRHQTFAALPAPEWDHQDMPFDRAREMLDGLLDWRAQDLRHLIERYRQAALDDARYRARHAPFTPPPPRNFAE